MAPISNAPAPNGLPAGAITVSGTTYTIDWLLQQPGRVTRVLANLTLQRFFVDQIFSPAGQITGGAVVYDQLTQNELYADRDVQRIEPGTEFPNLAFHRRTIKTAQVEKFGGKFPVTDEARRRNQQGVVNKALLQTANTIRRKTQQRALSELAAAVTEYTRTAAGTTWRTDMTTTYLNQTPSTKPGRDFAAVQRSIEETELGYEYDMVIMAPQEWESLQTIYGGPVSADAALASYGFSKKWVTNRKTAGTVYFLASGQVGELGYEVPLSTETWRDPEGRQQDWYQASVLPIVYVTDPFAILELTGVGS